MFPRGFKTWAEQTSVRARQQLKLSPLSPMDPFALAGILDVSILTPDHLPDLPPKLRRRLLTECRGHWSDITVMDANHHLIVTNSAHASTRQNSSLAHE